MSSVIGDALMESIAAAFAAGETAVWALRVYEENVEASNRMRADITALIGMVGSKTLLSPTALDRVDALGHALRSASAEKQVTEIVPDEHCVSGTREETLYVEDGEIIAGACKAVLNLSAALRRVRAYRIAETVSYNMRQGGQY